MSPVSRRLVVSGRRRRRDVSGLPGCGGCRTTRASCEIVAFERGPDTSFSACGIPYWIGGTWSRERADLIARAPAEFREQASRLTYAPDPWSPPSIRRGTFSVHVTDLASGREYSEHLRRPDACHWFGFRFRPRPARPGWRTGVLGRTQPGRWSPGHRALGSNPDTSTSTSSSSAPGMSVWRSPRPWPNRGLQVTIVDQSATPMIDPRSRTWAEHISAEAFGEDWPSTLVLGEKMPREIELDDSERSCTRPCGPRPGASIRADLVILGLGVRPNVALAEKSGGVPLGRDRSHRGGSPDAHQRTDGVWAAGDCVESLSRPDRTVSRWSSPSARMRTSRAGWPETTSAARIRLSKA